MTALKWMPGHIKLVRPMYDVAGHSDEVMSVV